ncbi:hypothetical protein AN414_17040 [Serratia marcescens]|nr:hypothetical protein AN414_17040 [Serratia marcescens]
MQNGRTVLRAFGDKLASAVFIGIMRTVNLGNDNLTGAATLAIKIVPGQKPEIIVLPMPEEIADIVDRATVNAAKIRQHLLSFAVAVVLVIDEAQHQEGQRHDDR